MTNFAVVSALIVLAVAALRFGRTTADPDLWGHVLNGLDTMKSGGYMPIDAYSYLSGAQPWVNHHWFGDLVMGFTYDRFETAGLVFIKAGLALGIVAVLVWWLMHRGLEPIRTALVGLLLVAVLTPTFGTLRPQLFTVLCATVLMLVMVGVASGRVHLLWTLPPLFAFWANVHGGVLAGLAIFGVWSVVHALRSRGRERFWPLLALGGSVVAAMVNPNGWGLLKFLLSTATVSRPEIQDWQSIDLLSPVGFVYLALMSIVVAGMIVNRKHLNLALDLPLLALLLAPLLAWRHLQLFAVGVAVLGAVHMVALSRRVGPQEGRTPADSGALRITAVALNVTVVVASLGFSWLTPCIRVDASEFEFPQRAAAAWAGLEPTGNTVVSFNWGEYMRWHFGPEVQVSTDGRRETVYTEDVYQANLDFLNGEGDWDSLLEMAPADWIFVPTAAPAVELVAQREDWNLIYQDPLATIFSQDEGSLVGDSGIPIDGEGTCFPAEF